MTNTGTDGLDAGGTAEAKRSIVSRRSLPNGRAVVGALLVTVAAVGAFVFTNSGDNGPNTRYLVLLRDIDAGDSISAEDLASEPMTLSPQLADIAFESAGAGSTRAVDGATALRFLHAGGLLLAPDLRGTAPIDGSDSTNIHELTLPVPLDRTPELLARGDRVTILAYNSRDEHTWVAFEDVLVLEFHAGSDGIGASSEGRLTLGLSDPRQVLRGTHLSFLELTVVLTTRAADDDFPEHYAGPVQPDRLSETGEIFNER